MSESGQPPAEVPEIRGRIPRGVWTLGCVSLLMDVSSEMIHGLLPLYVASVLGGGALAVGLIDGLGEATALVARLFSGVLSDRSGRRKPLAVAGYALGALAKPLFALAGSVGLVLAARLVDRLGKGIRGAPRDALVADLTPPPLRGAAYGLRQTLDTVGAFAGPLLAVALMALSGDDFRLVFWIAAVPAVLAVALLLFGLREPPARGSAGAARARFGRAELARLGGAFWAVVLVGMGLAVGRIGEAFLVLRAADVGLAFALAPFVLIAMNAAYGLSAYPAGWLFDRGGRRMLLGAGLALLLAADAVLAAAGGLAALALGVVLWGLHMGLTQGVIAALIAERAPADLRGTAFGVYNVALGGATLAAGLLGGLLWDWYGPSATFLGGAVAAAATFFLVPAPRSRARP